MIVMKFGGTLMGSTKAIQHSASLVLRSIQHGEKIVVVPSAMSGVTDQLIKISASAEQGHIAFANDEISLIRQRHLNTAHELGASAESLTVQKLLELLDSLGQTIHGIHLLRELSARSRDLIVSFGERLSAPLMALALERMGVRAHDLTGGQAGLVTTDNFGNARPLPLAYERIPSRLSGLLDQGITPVVTGFIGESEKGVITTLGRGGSDYSATILGAALSADEVWTWKDVDGVMTTDPRMVPEAQNLEQLSYEEIMEMAYFGAKVLHPLAVTPLQERGIPLRVKSAADPDFPGTLVTAHPKGLKNGVKAVTAIRNAAIIDVGGAGVQEVVAKIFDVLSDNAVNVIMISQSSSMANISLVVQRSDARRAYDALKTQFQGSDWIKNFELWEDVAVVAVVGEGMRGTKGVAARLFTAVAAEGISLHMIAQGSSELNISFAIDESDAEKAVKAIHKAFSLERLEPSDE
jgi:aspartate kinase